MKPEVARVLLDDGWLYCWVSGWGIPVPGVGSPQWIEVVW